MATQRLSPLSVRTRSRSSSSGGGGASSASPGPDSSAAAASACPAPVYPQTHSPRFSDSSPSSHSSPSSSPSSSASSSLDASAGSSLRTHSDSAYTLLKKKKRSSSRKKKSVTTRRRSSSAVSLVDAAKSDGEEDSDSASDGDGDAVADTDGASSSSTRSRHRTPTGSHARSRAARASHSGSDENRTGGMGHVAGSKTRRRERSNSTNSSGSHSGSEIRVNGPMSEIVFRAEFSTSTAQVVEDVRLPASANVWALKVALYQRTGARSEFHPSHLRVRLRDVNLTCEAARSNRLGLGTTKARGFLSFMEEEQTAPAPISPQDLVHDREKLELRAQETKARLGFANSKATGFLSLIEADDLAASPLASKILDNSASTSMATATSSFSGTSLPAASSSFAASSIHSSSASLSSASAPLLGAAADDDGQVLENPRRLNSYFLPDEVTVVVDVVDPSSVAHRASSSSSLASASSEGTLDGKQPQQPHSVSAKNSYIYDVGDLSKAIVGCVVPFRLCVVNSNFEPCSFSRQALSVTAVDELGAFYAPLQWSITEEADPEQKSAGTYLVHMCPKTTGVFTFRVFISGVEVLGSKRALTVLETSEASIPNLIANKELETAAKAFSLLSVSQQWTVLFEQLSSSQTLTLLLDRQSSSIALPILSTLLAQDDRKEEFFRMVEVDLLRGLLASVFVWRSSPCIREVFFMVLTSLAVSYQAFQSVISLQSFDQISWSKDHYCVYSGVVCLSELVSQDEFIQALLERENSLYRVSLVKMLLSVFSPIECPTHVTPIDFGGSEVEVRSTRFLKTLAVRTLWRCLDTEIITRMLYCNLDFSAIFPLIGDTDVSLRTEVTQLISKLLPLETARSSSPGPARNNSNAPVLPWRIVYVQLLRELVQCPRSLRWQSKSSVLLKRIRSSMQERSTSSGGEGDDQPNDEETSGTSPSGPSHTVALKSKHAHLSSPSQMVHHLQQVRFPSIQALLPSAVSSASVASSPDESVQTVFSSLVSEKLSELTLALKVIGRICTLAGDMNVAMPIDWEKHVSFNPSNPPEYTPQQISADVSTAISSVSEPSSPDASRLAKNMQTLPARFGGSGSVLPSSGRRTLLTALRPGSANVSPTSTLSLPVDVPTTGTTMGTTNLIQMLTTDLCTKALLSRLRSTSWPICYYSVHILGIIAPLLQLDDGMEQVVSSLYRVLHEIPLVDPSNPLDPQQLFEECLRTFSKLRGALLFRWNLPVSRPLLQRLLSVVLCPSTTNTDPQVYNAAVLMLAQQTRQETIRECILEQASSVLLRHLATKQNSDLACLDPFFHVPVAHTNQELEVLRLIDSGVSGKVWLANFRGQEVAVKVINPEGLAFERSEFELELAIMSVIHHPNLVCSIAACKNPPNMFIISQFFGAGNLACYFFESERTSRKRRLEIALDVAKGLEHLHSSGFIHRDVKAENVLLSVDGEVAVTDFGCASPIDMTEISQPFGTQAYMSPENIERKFYGPESDVYSFGILLWECWYWKRPYRSVDPLYLTDRVSEEGLRPPITKLHRVTELMQHCWSHTPSERPDLTTVVATLQSLINDYNTLVREVKNAKTVLSKPKHSNPNPTSSVGATAGSTASGSGSVSIVVGPKKGKEKELTSTKPRSGSPRVGRSASVIRRKE
eukprot:CAMPEP_0174245644 /NCGR_PEP_ID=MMETSP0417-20130205/40091_1 /TAXON_ID=242541 /ORGANISM="Mayorella sp, Strain BSH-02190019" /LENGTH=1640 /DNA_ID=CAMNT_0015325453 /DNA_START=77 /DNA_END=4999 /DNA_ORIENTATION=-